MSAGRLRHEDLQALVRGFNPRWTVARFYFVAFDNADGGRRLLEALYPPTSVRELADAEHAHNVSFTHGGLRALDLDPEIVAGFPADFRLGMAERAAENGDDGDSAPECWEAHWPRRDVHAWVGAYGRDDQALGAACERIEAALGAGARTVALQSARNLIAHADEPVYIDDPSTQPAPGSLLEHFGFRDGIADPGVAGLSDHRIEGGGKWTDGAWHALAPGEFLLGHVDELGERPLAPRPEVLSLNGTFMVYRKLEQRVEAFRRYVSAVAARSGVSADQVAAKMVGRRRDGDPLAPDWNTASGKRNAFLYAGDPEGRGCPLGAHVRRCNPRDSRATDSSLVNHHRIMRRGISYTDEDGTRGLVFIALNTNITRQFEFVQQQWVNFGNALGQGGDRDPIVGSQREGGRMVIPGDARAPTMVCGALERFVITRGGEYFFLPGIGALAWLIEGRYGYR